MVLQQGPNATTDYYLRPRLERTASTLPWTIRDLTDDPKDVLAFAASGCRPWVVLCRYVNEPWLRALERDRNRIARLSLLIDDDMRLMRQDRSLPLSTRGKVARGHGVFVSRLGAILDDLWVSTSVLRARYPGSVCLGPSPDAEPARPAAADNQRVVYHASDAHKAERVFALEVARRVVARGIGATFEITGDTRLARSARSVESVAIMPQTPWPVFRQTQTGRAAAILLAPLADTPLNRARSHIKVFDAARLGAVGLFSDADAYRTAVRSGVDGMLLPWNVEVWAQTITDLLTDPAKRMGLAEAARAKIVVARSSLTAAPFEVAEF